LNKVPTPYPPFKFKRPSVVHPAAFCRTGLAPSVLMLFWQEVLMKMLFITLFCLSGLLASTLSRAEEPVICMTQDFSDNTIDSDDDARFIEATYSCETTQSFTTGLEAVSITLDTASVFTACTGIGATASVFVKTTSAGVKIAKFIISRLPCENRSAKEIDREARQALCKRFGFLGVPCQI
jgi:hypothetical protein